MKNPKDIRALLILEDDPEQMELLSSLALSEIQALINYKDTHIDHKQQLSEIQVIKVSDIYSLKKAARAYPQTILALLDCNTPNTMNSAPHDQLVKTGYKITGQHTAVDIVRKYLPETPITTISVMLRFQRIVTRYYQEEHQFDVNFISKNEQETISRNIGHYLRQHLARLSGESYRVLDN